MLLVASAVQSAFGFGLALIALPLLSGVLPVASLVPLLALISLTIGASVAWRSRAAVERRLLWRLVVAAGLGVPFGVTLLVRLDETAVRVALGAVVVIAALQSLMSATAAEPTRPAPGARGASVWPLGFVTGVLGGAFNLMGPPLVLLMRRSGLEPAAFRATLHAFSIVINIVVIATFALGGLLDGGLLARYAIALPILALGGWLGGRLALRLDGARYRATVDLLLLALGAGLLVGALR